MTSATTIASNRSRARPGEARRNRRLGGADRTLRHVPTTCPRSTTSTWRRCEAPTSRCAAAGSTSGQSHGGRSPGNHAPHRQHLRADSVARAVPRAPGTEPARRARRQTCPEPPPRTAAPDDHVRRVACRRSAISLEGSPRRLDARCPAPELGGRSVASSARIRLASWRRAGGHPVRCALGETRARRCRERMEPA